MANKIFKKKHINNGRKNDLQRERGEIYMIFREIYTYPCVDMFNVNTSLFSNVVFLYKLLSVFRLQTKYRKMELLIKTPVSSILLIK